MRKTIVAILVLLAMCFSLTACGGCNHEWNKSTGECKLCGAKCEHEWNAAKGICDVCKMVCYHEKGTSENVACSTCGYKFEIYKTTEYLGIETEFVRLPTFWESKEAPQHGTIERVDYTTSVYEEPHDKYVMVYLPYNYDPNRTEPYNVIYFEHGNNSLIDILLSGKALNVLENMIYYSNYEPFILVNVSFYQTPNVTDGPAFDRRGDKNGEFHFDEEILTDVVPLVEAKYNTFAKNDVSSEGLIATRDHRAFTGYSRGSRCTWDMFHDALEYFKWWSPMSAPVDINADTEHPRPNDECLDYVKEAIAARPGMDFFVYAVCGGELDNGAVYAHQLGDFYAANYFSYGKDPSKNNFCVAISDFNHGDPWATTYFYDALQVFFK